MATQLNYPEIIKKILLDYGEYYSRDNEFPLKTLFDDKQQSYMLLDVGWYGQEYIHNAPIHLEIIDGKIWIQNDDTEDGVAADLLEAGVDRVDIVLGFRHPKIRPYTEFARG